MLLFGLACSRQTVKCRLAGMQDREIVKHAFVEWPELSRLLAFVEQQLSAIGGVGPSAEFIIKIVPPPALNKEWKASFFLCSGHTEKLKKSNKRKTKEHASIFVFHQGWLTFLANTLQISLGWRRDFYTLHLIHTHARARTLMHTHTRAHVEDTRTEVLATPLT